MRRSIFCRQLTLFEYAELVAPWAPSYREVMRTPWAELVDRYDEINGTNLRAELEAIGFPVIPYEGSATQRQRRAFCEARS